ncbi:Anti-sigma-K factor RskA [Streptomyces hundungensis]|uniref:Regulator of SigK n=1 Tax=Streptomyces hundungensis TaxID=1077946 RepID=A0A387H3H0_9ACTN|nr:anti-sigma factor [Streptomyces hundungensis]AYG78226.1 Anti-sigma-K factor RskA [Streptomyces hundungensis]
MNTAELHTLTGAYALHALSDEEHATFERHLRACDACVQEVRELAATAGKLGLAVSVVPPLELKDAVLRRIAAVRQDPPQTPAPARTTGRRFRPGRWSRFALAACLAAAAGLGGIAVWQHQRADDAQQQARAAQQQSEQLAQVLAAPDAKATTGTLKDGATGTLVVAHSRNQAVFVASGLPHPPDGKVYQLWLNDAGTMRPAGLLTPSRTTEAVLLAGPVNRASGMGITVEPAGGSPAPTSGPLVLMSFATT